MLRRLAWSALVVALVTLAVWHSWRGAPNHDEIEHLHAAWRLAHGDRPFVDFVEQHHPTLWPLLVPLVRGFDHPRTIVFVGRLADLALLGLTLLFTARLARALHPSTNARWAVLLVAVSLTFLRKSLEVRPDPLMNLCLVAGLAGWVLFVERPSLGRALASGALLGLAVAVLQKALVPVGLALGATLAVASLRPIARERRRALLVGAVAGGLAAAVPVAVLFAWMWRAGWWRDFWFWNYPFNRWFYLEVSLARHFPLSNTLLPALVEDPLLWLLGGLGVAVTIATLWRRRRQEWPLGDAHLVVLVVLGGYSVFLARNKFPLEQYYLVPLPLVAAYAGAGLERVAAWVRDRGRWRFVPVAVQLLIVATIVPLAVRLARDPDGQRFWDLQSYVLAHTRPDETIFVAPEFNPIVREDAAYFWYNATLLRSVYLSYCSNHACEDRKDAVDDAEWQRRPPSYVFRHPDADYPPLRWNDYAQDYVATEVPDLLVRRDLRR